MFLKPVNENILVTVLKQALADDSLMINSPHTLQARVSVKS